MGAMSHEIYNLKSTIDMLYKRIEDRDGAIQALEDIIEIRDDEIDGLRGTRDHYRRRVAYLSVELTNRGRSNIAMFLCGGVLALGVVWVTVICVGMK